MDAEGWLAAESRLIETGTWVAPRHRRSATQPVAFGPYAAAWLAERDLKPRTRSLYRNLLRLHILPAFGSTAVESIRPDMVRLWYSGTDAATPTARAHAYSLLRTIMTTAVHDEILGANPCHLRGAGTAKRRHEPEPATLDELEVLVKALPDKYRLLTLLAAWCALRFGELTELRRSDFNLTSGVIHVRRGVVRADGDVVVGRPKSDASIRDVAIPPHLIPVIRAHQRSHAAFGRDGLMFPAVHGGHLAQSTLAKVFYPARDKAGRPDLRFHDLRHTGAVLAASTGATLAELMSRLGHSTADAAMRYQHAVKGRDAEIAAALSGLVEHK